MVTVEGHWRRGRWVHEHDRKIFREKIDRDKKIIDIDVNRDKNFDIRMIARPDKTSGTVPVRVPSTGEFKGRRLSDSKTADRVVWRTVESKPLQGLKSVRNPSEVKSDFRAGTIFGRVGK